MGKLLKAYLTLGLVSSLSIGGSTAFAATAQEIATAVQAMQAPKIKDMKQITAETDFLKTECAKGPTECDFAKLSIYGAGVAKSGTCSDEAKTAQKGIEDASKEAHKACASLADEDSADKASGSLGACLKMIDECGRLSNAVKGLDPEETKSDDHTDALLQFANNTQLQQMGIQIPKQKKTETLQDEEKEYYNKCPMMSDDSYTTQLKALEEKKDKIKEDIAKKKKEIVEAMTKANKDMEDYNKKKSERAERGRKDKSEYEKEIQRISQDYNKQTGELLKAESEAVKARNIVDAEYNSLEKKRAKLAVDLSGISVELSGACKGKYHEMLAKVPAANRRVNGAAAAIESRDYKLAFMKRCVRDQWFEVKQQYDKIKAELNSLKSEKENARKQLAAINTEKQNMVQMKARQDQSVQQGEQDRASAAFQLENEMIQSAQRGVLQNQQTGQNLQNDITNLETQESKVDNRIIKLGKKPSGKATLSEAKTAVNALRINVESAEAQLAADTSGSPCKALSDIASTARDALKTTNKEAKPDKDKKDGAVAANGARSQK